MLNNYPLLFFFDTGSSVTSINTASIQRFGIDVNKLKKKSTRYYGVEGSIKKHKYKYNNFECFTISDDVMSYLKVNKTYLTDIWRTNVIAIDGILGADWFKDKAIRVDMKNGLFEISE